MVNTSATRATPGRFDAASKHRNSMLGKIHVAQKQLGMIDDDYRQLLFAATGQVSLKHCDDRQLARVIDALKGKGFRPMPKGQPYGVKGVAMHPMARKARALWISLYQLGVVHNPADEALEAFAKRQIGCDRLIWAKQSDAFKLVEALKSMARRGGWLMEPIGRGKALGVTELQASLCQAILAKLKAVGAVPDDWALHDAALRLCGIENAKATPWTADDYQRLAGGLGDKLRAATPAGGAS